MADEIGTIYLARQQYLGGKLETDRGTPATLANADFNILARDIKLSNATEENIRKYAVGDPYPFQSVMGRRPVTLAFNVDMQGSGDNLVDPVFFKLLKAGPFQSAVTSSTRGLLLALGNQTMTFSVQEKQFAATNPTGKEYLIKGCALSKCLAHFDNAGELQRLDLEYLGALYSVADLTANSNAVPVLTDDDTLPPAILGIDLSYRSADLPTQMVSVDFGLKTELIQWPQDETGFAYAICGDIDPIINFNPLIQPESIQEYYADLTTTGTLGPFTMTIGSGDAEALTITAPNAQVVKALDLDQRNNVDSTNVMLRCLRTDTAANPCIGIFMAADPA